MLKMEFSDANGVTPLHVACRVSDKLGVELLLEAGADCFAKDLWSFTPLDYAAAAGNVSESYLLRQHFLPRAYHMFSNV